MRDFCFGDGLRRVIPLWRSVDAPVKNSERKHVEDVGCGFARNLDARRNDNRSTAWVAEAAAVAEVVAGAGGGAGGGNWQTGVNPTTNDGASAAPEQLQCAGHPHRERRCRSQ